MSRSVAADGSEAVADAEAATVAAAPAAAGGRCRVAAAKMDEERQAAAEEGGGRGVLELRIALGAMIPALDPDPGSDFYLLNDSVSGLRSSKNRIITHIEV